MDAITIKRSPAVLLRTLIAVELVAIGLYIVGSIGFFDTYKQYLYDLLPFSASVPYRDFKLPVLSFVQFLITAYAFLCWYYERYSITAEAISHERGVLFKKKKNIVLQKTMSTTLASGPIGKLLHYGSIHIRNAERGDSITLADVSHPQEILELITKRIQAPGRTHANQLAVADILSQNEHERLEFKSSLRFDRRSRQINRDVEKAAMKSVAAFLNSNGGNLVIGVDDSRQIVGLKDDYDTLGRKDRDGFENHFTQVFNAMIGPEFRHLVTLRFHTVQGYDACVVGVDPAARPVYLKLDNNEHFYVRTGNVTTPLKLSEVESYALAHWHAE